MRGEKSPLFFFKEVRYGKGTLIAALYALLKGISGWMTATGIKRLFKKEDDQFDQGYWQGPSNGKYGQSIHESCVDC